MDNNELSIQNNFNPMLSMDYIKIKKKTIKVFCISKADEQEAFEKVYNDENATVIILKDFFNKFGEYFLACEIRYTEQESKDTNK